ncbi:MAG: DUF2442 domain-containing protein [Novosphingobium sp.]
MSIGIITAVTVSGDRAITLTWDDGEIAPVNLAATIAALKALAPLTDPVEFSQARLSHDGWSVEWPSGIDFGAPQLRRWAHEQSGKAMPPALFRAWIDRHHFTLDRAAEALGLSRRTVAYYLSGEQPVPRTVMLATVGFDRQQAA